MPSRRSAVFFAVAVSMALIAAIPTFAAKNGIPGKPDKGGESAAVNNLSFPLHITGDPLGTIPSAVPQGTSSLDGLYYLWDGTNPPCDPAETGCLETFPYRVYIQKDPDNKWQAEWLANLVAPPDYEPLGVEFIDVADNLESVPWRTTSVVRIEFVPFASSALTGFEMVYVSGQGTNEVWGARAANQDPTSADIANPLYATLFSSTMALSMTKLEDGPGSIDVAPDPNGTAYTWDAQNKVWVRANTTAVSQTDKVEPFTAEINVKGRLIYGSNWMLKRTVMAPGVSKDGWWRLTFYSTVSPSPLDFPAMTPAYMVDPTAEPTTEEITVAAEEPGGTYPRVPVVNETQDLVYIDIYIQASTGGGTGGKGQGNKP